MFLKWLQRQRLRYKIVSPALPNSSQESVHDKIAEKSAWDWRSNVKLALLISTVTLVANFVLMVVGIAVRGQDGGIGTLHEGRAKYIARLSTAYHILINILSTGLLTSSNYCMQLVCAPTRQDINRLHARGTYFDIGILSFRNVRHVAQPRALLWLVLAASSIPLHLLYNSSIFSVTVGRNYEIDFLNASDPKTIANYSAGYERLENSIWMEKYDTKYIPDYGNLYLVLDAVAFELGFSPGNVSWELLPPKSITEQPAWGQILSPSWDAKAWAVNVTLQLDNTSKSSGSGNISSTGVRRQIPIHEYSPQTMPEVSWPSPYQFDISKNNSWKDVLKLSHDTWMYPPWHIGYGLAESSHKGSAVQISVAFIAVVLTCNAVKTIAIYFTLRGSYSAQIITQGDAISTFLQVPDTLTVGRCVADKYALIQGIRHAQNATEGKWSYQIGRYSDRARRRWTSHMMLGLLIVISTLGIVALSTKKPSAWGTASKLHIPFAVSPLDARGIIFTSWLANSPQLLLSIFYLAANRICTSLCFAREWNALAQTRKPLRVTQPKGEQRSAHFLQLPYRWAIPLTAISGLLHWLLSQSLFLVRIEVYDKDQGLREDASICACGYSTLSLLVFLICLLAMAVSILALMCREIQYAIPPADHCSLAISAACHPPPDEVDCHLGPVQWGVVPNSFGGEVDHCTISGQEVNSPEEGRYYA